MATAIGAGDLFKRAIGPTASHWIGRFGSTWSYAFGSPIDGRPNRRSLAVVDAGRVLLAGRRSHRLRRCFREVHRICGELGFTHYENLINLHRLVGRGRQRKKLKELVPELVRAGLSARRVHPRSRQWRIGSTSG